MKFILYQDFLNKFWTRFSGKNKGDAGVLTGSTNLVSSPKRYNPNFHIFLQWSRNNCGLEFLDAIESGDVQFDVMDQYDGKRGIFLFQLEKP